MDDHPQLTVGAIRELYDAFATEVLALDPCVYQDVKKLYIAFKAETNFVNVIPRAKRLLLSINIAATDLEDPRDFGRDSIGLG